MYHPLINHNRHSQTVEHTQLNVDRIRHPPFLLIHGFGSAGKQWLQNMEPLSRYAPVYSLDLLGFGWSEKGATTYNSQLWLEQIHDFWATFIRQPMVLVGHSLGALVASRVAVDRPDLVQRLVLVTVPNTRQDMIPAKWLQTSVGAVERLFTSPLLVRLIFNVARQPRLIRSALQSIYQKRDRVSDALVAQFVTPTSDRGAAQTLARLTQSATQPNYSPSRHHLLHAIPQPTLVIWGLNDNIVPLQGCDAEIRANPQIRLVTIPNAGHCVYDECADEFNRAIAQWLDEG
ncbi:MAG: alpha/beta fold hydrolase [Leptolyngbyaceae bacterium]|nr:alpha/beta fold hydrolase [Leptolyngbyaceae bacterium]